MYTSGMRYETRASRDASDIATASEVLSDHFTQHLSDFHVQEQCQHRGAKAQCAVRLSEHLEKCHVLSPPDLPNIYPPAPSAHASSTPAQAMTLMPVLCPRESDSQPRRRHQTSVSKMLLLLSLPEYLRWHQRLRCRFHTKKNQEPVPGWC
ncbi:unnamed protein product [Boreogadus saida]